MGVMFSMLHSALFIMQWWRWKGTKMDWNTVFFPFCIQFRFLLNFVKEKPRNKPIPVHFRPLLHRKHYRSSVRFGCQQIVGLLLTSKFMNILLFISNVTT